MSLQKMKAQIAQLSADKRLELLTAMVGSLPQGTVPSISSLSSIFQDTESSPNLDKDGYYWEADDDDYSWGEEAQFIDELLDLINASQEENTDEREAYERVKLALKKEWKA